MTAAELNATLEALGWSQRELSRRLGADKMRVNKWAHGEERVPGEVAYWVTRMRMAMARIPPPVRFQSVPSWRDKEKARIAGPGR